jgi:SET domain-containing protein
MSLDFDLAIRINEVLDNIPNTEILRSDIEGFGLFAEDHFAAKQILCNLDGQIIAWNKYDEILLRYIKRLNISIKELYTEWNAIDTDTLLVRFFRTKYSYINHSNTPNCAVKYHPLRIETLKYIKEGEELTLNYKKEPLRDKYLEGHGATYLD